MGFGKIGHTLWSGVITETGETEQQESESPEQRTFSKCASCQRSAFSIQTARDRAGSNSALLCEAAGTIQGVRVF